jgi:hypothetical protein
MSTRIAASRCLRALAAGGFALVLPLAALAADDAPPETLYVKVFPDRYIAAGMRFSDLTALEAWAKPILIRSVWLDSCSPASTKQLVAAVERFHSAYAEGVQVRTLHPDEAGCVAAAAGGVATGESMQQAGAGYYATDRLGRSTLP